MRVNSSVLLLNFSTFNRDMKLELLRSSSISFVGRIARLSPVWALATISYLFIKLSNKWFCSPSEEWVCFTSICDNRW